MAEGEMGVGLFSRLTSFLELRWLGRERVVAYSCILLLVSVVSCVPSYLHATGAVGSDFLAFWSAGRLVVGGAASSVYDIRATYAVQAALGRHDVFAFVNPPPFLLVVWPLGYLPYNLAWIVWVAATYAFWLALSRRCCRGLGWPVAAFPGALVAAWHAQTGLLTGGLQAGAGGWLARRPWLAGCCIGALIVKPHLALLFPVALAAGRLWRAFAGAALSTVGLLLLAWLIFGAQTMLAYPRSFAVSRYLMATGDTDFFLRQVTVYAAVRVAASPWAAIAAQALASAAVAALTWRVWSRPGPIEGKVALLMAATPLATPYLFSYDLPFLILPVCWLLREARLRPGGRWERPMLLFFYLSPLATRALALPLGANLTPWVQVWMLWAVWERLRQSTPTEESAALAMDEHSQWRTS
jgi:hypothetical protein